VITPDSPKELELPYPPGNITGAETLKFVEVYSFACAKPITVSPKIQIANILLIISMAVG
jgi:hypothetical protein